ncbi:unnamed protein product [Malus baccata var. baccata]
MDGLFSIKSDLFSFGVLTSKLWNVGKGLEIIDSSYSHSEVLRCMQIGLLCVQERAEDRATMSSVVMTLSSETAATMPHPFIQQAGRML